MEKRILVVEDNPVAQMIEKTILEESGLEVDCVESGESALSLIEKCHYDLILMDIGLPGIDGIETAKQIKNYESSHHLTSVPIIAITANANQANESLCLAAGMSEMIGKPLRSEQASSLVAKYLH
ncbi:MAG: response regulator [Gammaproteobacteria bacterium]|nr:response regulator [Gammaproteobacteria bacterium]